MTRTPTLPCLLLVVVGCFGQPRQDLPELDPPVRVHDGPPASRKLWFYALDGSRLEDPREFRDGYVFSPAPSDAGSAGIGEWYEYRDLRRVAGPIRERPEAVWDADRRAAERAKRTRSD